MKIRWFECWAYSMAVVNVFLYSYGIGWKAGLWALFMWSSVSCMLFIVERQRDADIKNGLKIWD